MTSTGHEDLAGGKERQGRIRNGSHQSSVIQCKPIYPFPHPLLISDFPYREKIVLIGEKFDRNSYIFYHIDSWVRKSIILFIINIHLGNIVIGKGKHLRCSFEE